ncbi:MAG TPA: hypothetical protein VNW97_21940 [Candidatus Saccharimonadales bacterium]|jgi:hypothetical protein|nr:hypothetical protein [Candidatus Saccharimonadales bacterium]
MTPALQKLELYRRVFALNRALTHVVLNCDQLETLGFFPSEPVRAWRVAAQLLQSEASSVMLEALQSLEEKESFEFDQIRHEWEKQTRDPDDVLLAAEERKREIREQLKGLKQGKKRPPGKKNR